MQSPNTHSSKTSKLGLRDFEPALDGEGWRPKVLLIVENRRRECAVGVLKNNTIALGKLSAIHADFD
jgi:hypothetical protein